MVVRMRAENSSVFWCVRWCEMIACHARRAPSHPHKNRHRHKHTKSQCMTIMAWICVRVRCGIHLLSLQRARISFKCDEMDATNHFALILFPFRTILAKIAHIFGFTVTHLSSSGCFDFNRTKPRERKRMEKVRVKTRQISIYKNSWSLHLHRFCKHAKTNFKSTPTTIPKRSDFLYSRRNNLLVMDYLFISLFLRINQTHQNKRESFAFLLIIIRWYILAWRVVATVWVCI